MRDMAVGVRLDRRRLARPAAILRRDGSRSELHAESSVESITCDPSCRKFGLDGGNRAVEIDGAAGIAQHEGRQAEAARIERRVAHAIVVGQPSQKDALEPALAQIAGEAGRRCAVVLKKRRIGIDLRAKAFAQDQLGLR